MLAVTFAQAPDEPVGHRSDPPAESGVVADKKTAYLAEKARDRRLRPSPRRGWRAHAPVWAHNLRTHEIVVLTGPGALQSEARDRFFKCWFTLEHGDLPDPLIDEVIAVAQHFEVRGIKVISGFRHPKYNLSLVKKGREVARNSQHTLGHAIDFYLPGVATKPLYEYLVATHDGGVGYYPVSEFVHVDVGRKRTWRGT